LSGCTLRCLLPRFSGELSFRERARQHKYPTGCPTTNQLVTSCWDLVETPVTSLTANRAEAWQATPTVATSSTNRTASLLAPLSHELAQSALSHAANSGALDCESPKADTVMILPQVHLRKPCYDFYFLEMFSIDELPRHSREACASQGPSPNASTKHPLGSSDGRCVQRAGT
jgi:hypothetical protein